MVSISLNNVVPRLTNKVLGNELLLDRGWDLVHSIV